MHLEAVSHQTCCHCESIVLHYACGVNAVKKQTTPPWIDLGGSGRAGELCQILRRTAPPTISDGSGGAGDMALSDSEDASFGIEDGIYDNTDLDG
jgi:hypothetical protein